MGRKSGTILATVLFVVYSSIVMSCIERVLISAVGRGEQMDMLWLILALIGLPVSGLLTALTLMLLNKIL